MHACTVYILTTPEYCIESILKTLHLQHLKVLTVPTGEHCFLSRLGPSAKARRYLYMKRVQDLHLKTSGGFRFQPGVQLHSSMNFQAAFEVRLSFDKPFLKIRVSTSFQEDLIQKASGRLLKSCSTAKQGLHQSERVLNSRFDPHSSSAWVASWSKR